MYHIKILLQLCVCIYVTAHEYAVVHPVRKHEVEDLLYKLRFQPRACVMPNDHSYVDLIFYVNVEGMGRMREFRSEVTAALGSNAACFRSIIMFRQPSCEDCDRPTGAGKSFYQLILSNILRPYRFWMWQETDCVPIRDGWLDMFIEVLHPMNDELASFFMMGSSSVLVRDDRPLINGNAIYMGLAHPEFVNFLPFLNAAEDGSLGWFDDEIGHAIKTHPYYFQVKYVYSPFILYVGAGATTTDLTTELFEAHTGTFFMHGLRYNKLYKTVAIAANIPSYTVLW